MVCLYYLYSSQSRYNRLGEALGTVFPRPLASLRTACAFPSTPSHFVTAPVGHWGPYSPDPLRRFAPCPGLALLGLASWGQFFLFNAEIDYVRFVSDLVEGDETDDLFLVQGAVMGLLPPY